MGGESYSERHVTSAAARTALRHFNADDAVFTKEFYFLHVKLVETQARLLGWEFSVTITDVTDPNRLLRHTFKNLRVNEHMHIVFKPPHQVHLSPADDIPWVSAPESLFMHTLRIEVYATHPARSKVVDSMVFFGDVIPDESVGTLAASKPSPPLPPPSRASTTTHHTASRPASGHRTKRDLDRRPHTAGSRASGNAELSAQLQGRWPEMTAVPRAGRAGL